MLKEASLFDKVTIKPQIILYIIHQTEWKHATCDREILLREKFLDTNWIGFSSRMLFSPSYGEGSQFAMKPMIIWLI